MRSIRALILSALSIFGSSIQQQGATPLTVVQQVSNHASGPTTLTITIASAAVGDLLAVFSTNTTGGTTNVSGITCTNVAFSNLAASHPGVAGQNTEIWVGVVAGGASGTSVVITYTVGTTSGAIATQFNSSSAWTATDGGAGNFGTGTAATTGAYSSTAQGLVLTAVGFQGTGTTASSPGGIFTDLTFLAQANVNLLASYGTSIAGAKAANWTLSGSVNWGSAIGGEKNNASGSNTGNLPSKSWISQ